jgi:hypothetical protein
MPIISPGMIAFRNLVNEIKKYVSLPGVVAVNLLAKTYKTMAEKKDSSLDSVGAAKEALKIFESDFKSGKHKSHMEKALKKAENKVKNRKPKNIIKN